MLFEVVHFHAVLSSTEIHMLLYLVYWLDMKAKKKIMLTLPSYFMVIAVLLPNSDWNMIV